MATSTTRAVVKAYWRYVKPQTWTVVFLLLTVTAGCVLELIVPLFYKSLFNDLAYGTKGNASLVTNMYGLVFVILALNAASWLMFRVSAVVDALFMTRITANIDEDSFAYLLGHSYSFFTNNFAGGLTRKIKRFSDAFDTIESVIVWNILGLAVIVVGSLIVLFQRHVLLGFTVLVSIVFIFVANVLFSVWKLKYDIRRSARDTEVSGTLTDAITNSVNVKLFTGTGHESSIFHDVRQSLRSASLTSWLLAEGSFAVQTTIMVIIEFMVVYVAIGLWSQGILTVGDFALIQAYLLSLFKSIWNIGRVMRKLYEATADAKEMVDVLDMPYGVQDKRGAKRLTVRGGTIGIEGVAFCYSQTRKILDGLDLAIKPGERVALVGPSGAGKSTVVKLLLRFHDLDAGRITIDGQDISRVTQDSLRANIGFVPQDPILFHRTLMENIRYGRRSATESQVIRASKLAHCHDFIKDLSEGYNTYVGERGIKLSGGERQRVAIARAILKDAPILVLDEATSSLDSESEAMIQDALKTLMAGKTVVVIAHRLSTIMQMDRIVVIDRGRIVDQGTHQELLSRAGLYQKLWNIQAGGFMP